MKYEVRKALDDALGFGHSTARNNIAYQCPFPRCKTRGTGKTKLEVNLDTGQWHCWVCHARGRSIRSLFDAIHAKYTLQDSEVRAQSFDDVFDPPKRSASIAELPAEFRPLHRGPLDFYGRKALAYLHSRGVTDDDVLTYNIGYCNAGPYDGYLVFPNYDDQGHLNYFTTRAYLPGRPKTKNPPVPRAGVVGFELLINWALPVVIVESALDAITVGQNALPMYGSGFSSWIRKLVYDKQVPEVVLCFDGDAYSSAMHEAGKLVANGVTVKVPKLPEDQDPNSLGRTRVWQYIDSAEPVAYDDVVFAAAGVA